MNFISWNKKFDKRTIIEQLLLLKLFSWFAYQGNTQDESPVVQAQCSTNSPVVQAPGKFQGETFFMPPQCFHRWGVILLISIISNHYNIPAIVKVPGSRDSPVLAPLGSFSTFFTFPEPWFPRASVTAELAYMTITPRKFAKPEIHLGYLYSDEMKQVDEKTSLENLVTLSLLVKIVNLLKINNALFSRLFRSAK
jgi:hypothetical protein